MKLWRWWLRYYPKSGTWQAWGQTENGEVGSLAPVRSTKAEAATDGTLTGVPEVALQ